MLHDIAKYATAQYYSYHNQNTDSTLSKLEIYEGSCHSTKQECPGTAGRCWWSAATINCFRTLLLDKKWNSMEGARTSASGGFPGVCHMNRFAGHARKLRGSESRD